MYLRRYITFITLFISCSLFAQKPTDATQLFDAGRYAEAAQVNRQLLKKKPNDGMLNYRLARCLVALGQKEEALLYFKTAAENGFDKAYCTLGDIYFDDYRFAEATEAYTHWLENESLTEEEKSCYNERLRQAELGAQLLTRIEDIALIDSIIVTKENLLSAIALPQELGHLGYDQASQPLFESGRRDRRYTTQINDTQTDLFEANNFMSEWSAPTPLEALNSDKNESYPFVAADGITIYFGSKGHDGLGGYDIFTSRYNSDRDEFLPPQNVGFPFNSTANDYLLVIDEEDSIGWFATDRFCTGDNVIIYRFVPNKQRTILRDKTDEELREAAQLHTYRHCQVQKTNSAPDSLVLELTNKLFIVNDTICYASENDFISETARQGFAKLRELQVLQVQKRFTLQAKRELWQITEEEYERNEISQEILGLEKELHNLSSEIKAYEKQIRAAENAALQAN